MTNPTHADRIIRQGRALVRAIEALDAVAPEGWFEQIVVALVRTIYLQRLRRLSVMMPMWAVRYVASARGRASGEEAGKPAPTVIGGWW